MSPSGSQGGGWRARLSSLTGRAKPPDPSSAKSSKAKPQQSREDGYFTDRPVVKKTAQGSRTSDISIQYPAERSKTPMPTPSSTLWFDPGTAVTSGGASSAEPTFTYFAAVANVAVIHTYTTRAIILATSPGSIWEKYVYRTLYYVAPPYTFEKYCGPSFHEGFADHPPKRSLDVGAGYWYWLRDASAYWKHTKFVAFDYFELPHCHIPNDQLKRITFVQGDLLSRNRLPFQDGEFEHIRLANMRLAIPDAEHLSKKLCSGGVLEIIDDGWMPPPIPQDSPVDHVFLRPYERLFEKMLMSRGFICKLNLPDQWEIVIEGYVERTPGLEFVLRGTAPVMPFDLDQDSELRWHRAYMLAEDAIRFTLEPQIANLHRSSPDTPETLEGKIRAFREDLQAMSDRIAE
ncbi:hypothetical protein CALVIDRAFT_529897 [Calocera viscosa TUFC12733]|uniref:Methyltransferase domain-containing protein n=1 Tax=Calocera viscosa (strain TUFC12733) TaxID=1330018 RepID=A0A167IL72_CALVF|nr:hypothetical protein CALVIDRAFT_529897 [Calocera viscosa TUFC12733]